MVYVPPTPPGNESDFSIGIILPDGGLSIGPVPVSCHFDLCSSQLFSCFGFIVGLTRQGSIQISF
jgi:hypothetical protein